MNHLKDPQSLSRLGRVNPALLDDFLNHRSAGFSLPL
jgi:hypothetical protein